MIKVVGIGSGQVKNLTLEAIEAIKTAEVIVGYRTYIEWIQPLIDQNSKAQKIITTGMTGEVKRCQAALEASRKGENVVVISSGDSGIYGMAGLIYELSDSEDEIRVIPGVTSSSIAAATLGAPLMHDFVSISLSDLMTTYDLIMKRVRLAAEGDFVICLYNPRSKGRPHHLEDALKIIKDIQGDDLVVGRVTDAGREEEEVAYSTLKEFDVQDVNMRTMVIIGNQNTHMHHGKMVTPRGYRL
ncbi:putative cobalt-factor III C(17)-methyltransferase [Petrocella atlantisensis]|uniref:Putative cobalt-factor III C(17)-methyltransferase n=1 Tax=Petrocella atlantisensis TaxID=2173034 RepID=A0A3P7PAX0_9FIRM|nr:precorrin-3B C(17)-methyltransferase [Petrocella atlantisensis]VDN46068.1 putative cobalt-factor III C(17)-methyltransferase [Petrocella atlantisensis]